MLKIKPKPKILHVISSLKIGGAEQILYDILENLQNSFEHEVVFFHDGPVRNKIEQLGIKTTQISGLINYDPFFLFRFYRAIIKSNPNLISSSLWSANLLSRIYGKILNIPVINTVHALPEFEGKFRNFIDNFSLNLATKNISVSENITQEILKRKIISTNNLLTIKNGINLPQFNKKLKKFGLSKTDINLEPESFVIGTVGRFIKAKNQALLIKAFKDININFENSSLILVGIGPEETALKILAKQLGLDNKIKFFVGEPAYKYLPIFDCFVLPSKFEGLSLALLEAMACQIPVIVTGRSKKHEIIKDRKTGLIIEIDSEKELVQAISRLIKNKKLGQQIALNGLETIKTDFLSTKMSQKYQNIFISLFSK